MLRKIMNLVAVVAVSFGGLAACSGGEKPAAKKEEAKPMAEAAKPAASMAVPSEKGSVEVTVAFTGAPPKMPKLKKEADSFCAKSPEPAQEVVVNGNGTLRYAVAQIDGVPGTYPAPAEEVMLDQKNCMYEPHVASAQLDQSIDIHNSDPVLHNVHTYEGKKTLFNQAQVPGTPAIKKTFSNGSKIVKFTCDVHPWMTGWLVLNANPFHGTTGEDGKVTIKDVPVGSYKLEVWQERYGTKTVDVTVTANQTAAVSVSYDGTESGG